ncbi:LysR family transcriptional regulator substrate-binding protein [Frondihabitans australicus]|uniref:LysR substrate binding domain-containing protein n=1 Tax=Frondihabitans australicus TaxID=386892 RepID=A0A495IJP8_9MICO|nr:LysR family transcriptional regulator substrate-binding protein [Frondihabitans australicus]RKR75345.1 LysR substrate binding domain-containing protein [Frondihabitans australicus]
MPDEPPFRVGIVPGVTLTKWSRVWSERHPSRPLAVSVLEAQDPTAALRDDLDVLLARLPIPAEGFHAIRLYDEQPFVVLPKGHVLADLDALDVEDLEGETRHDLDATLGPAVQIEVVGAGAGVTVLPQSLARLHSRKDVVSRPLSGVPPTTIALVWPEGRDSDDIQDFIGIVRGRTANSSRGRSADADAGGGAAPARPSQKPQAAAPKTRGAAGARGRRPAAGSGSSRRRGRR